jgi:phospholipid/cholesterol/gamma-HCH transport system substrate-binding protein
MIGFSLSMAAAIVVFTILWLGKSNFFAKGVQINMVVEDANGITTGDEVFYRGLKVGNITDASITRNAVLLRLKIEQVDKIPVDSRFEIGNFSLISGKAIAINPGSSTACLQPEDTVIGYTAYGLNQAMAGLQNLESQISHVISNVNAMTGDNTRRRVDSVLDNLNSTITELNIQVNGNLKQTLTNVNRITSENKENVTLLIQSLSENSKQLSTFLNTSSESANELNSLLSNLNAGKGSLGNIVKSDSLYKSLNKTISSIDSLVIDIKANPKRYVKVSVF